MKTTIEIKIESCKTCPLVIFPYDPNEPYCGIGEQEEISLVTFNKDEIPHYCPLLKFKKTGKPVGDSNHR